MAVLSELTLRRAVVLCYAFAVLTITACNLVSVVDSSYADIDQDCISGSQTGNSHGQSPLPGADPIPCDVIIGAKVEQNQATLTVDAGPYAKDQSYDGSADIAGKVVLFPPSGPNGATTQDGNVVPDDGKPNTKSVIGGHEITVITSSNTGAFVQVSAHSSKAHGISTGSYEGMMVCIAFCQKNSDINDASTVIKPNEKDCAANSTNPADGNYGMDNGDIPSPCILAPNTWGFKVGLKPECNNPSYAGYNTSECFGKRDIDYKPVPHEQETPYTVISKSSVVNPNTPFTNYVFYAVATNKDLRPGIYGVTTIYTLTTEVP